MSTPGGVKDPGGKGDSPRAQVLRPQPLSLFVFKTFADLSPAVYQLLQGKSGILKNDATLTNYNRTFRNASAYPGRSRQASEVGELRAGDIGGYRQTEGNTPRNSCDKASPIFYSHRATSASITFAIEPKTRADEDRSASPFIKILEEESRAPLFARSANQEFLLAVPPAAHEVVAPKLHAITSISL